MAKPKILSRNCARCGGYFNGSAYYPTNSPFFPDGHLTICKECLQDFIDPKQWSTMDRLCQWANYPFLVDKWAPLADAEGKKAIHSYITTYCLAGEHAATTWEVTNAHWNRLMEEGTINNALPVISTAELAKLRHKWGADYSDEDLQYMEDFYANLERSHNMVTELQRDAARNLAKLSVRISKKISSDGEVDKDIKSYNELMKSGGFSVDNVKNMGDFESVGEIAAYLEKTGWVNEYYDGAPKDIVDETIANMQAYLRRIVLGEVNLREQAEEKLAALGLADIASEGITEAEFTRYENEGFVELEGGDTIEDEDEELDVGGR